MVRTVDEAAYWSLRARERQASREPDDGVMWESDHDRPLDQGEYEHWARHPLPAGWTIGRVPDHAACPGHGEQPRWVHGQAWKLSS